MMKNGYDAIVVGARCAGSPTAMLLARKGYNVLVVDRATFPSDAISTHLIHPPGVAALRRWGLLGRLQATGCPCIDTYAFDFGPFAMSGAPGTEEAPVAYAPRRTILDKLLLDAAAEAGAEVREAFTVDDVVADKGRVTGIRGHSKNGHIVTEHARVVIGADGRQSLIANAVGPRHYYDRPPLLVGYYSYWSGLPTNGRLETYARPHRAFAAWGTNDDLTLILGVWPFAEFNVNKRDVEGNFLKMLELVPAFAARVRAGKREVRFVGTAVANYFRRPYGPGWVLVGDAGYNKDFITGQGIQDSFRDAELAAAALDETFTGARTSDDAMSDYQSSRDAQVLPMYEFTTQLATLEPPWFQPVLAAIHCSQDAADGFARVNSGVTSPAEFFSVENVGRIIAHEGRTVSHPSQS